jgi:CBS domain containing-hemolysin-like protein
MTFIGQAVTIQTETPARDILALCRDKGFTRLPVWEQRNGSRRIVGFVSCNTILYQSGLDPARAARDFLKPALYLDEDLRLEVALQRLQRGGQRLAIVLGRDRRETGILTLQGVLRVIFGEVSL